MTLLYMDGFDLQDAGVRWIQNNAAGATLSYGTATRFNSGKCLSMIPNNNWQIFTIKRQIPASSQVFIGAALQVGLEADQPSPNGNDPWGTFFGLFTDGGQSGQIYLRRLNTNSIALYRGDGSIPSTFNYAGTLLAQTAAGVLDGNWHYVEMSATINASTGNVVVKVDGTQVLTFTGNTKNTGTSNNVDTIGFHTGSYNMTTGLNMSIDDLYVCDANGTVNNTFLGDVRVQSMIPNGAGSSTQLTPTGSASNYANAGDNPYNDATYNSSATVGQRDTYALSDLAVGTTSIMGVQSVSHMQKSDAGIANAKIALKSGASVYYDTTQSLGTSVAAYTQLRENDPATSAAWTVAGANALEAGMEVA